MVEQKFLTGSRQIGKLWDDGWQRGPLARLHEPMQNGQETIQLLNLATPGTALILLLMSAVPLSGQSVRHHAQSSPDSGFAAMQSRGKIAMGVDQYTSAHRFDDLPDGGRIELQRDSSDTAGVQAIRGHLRGIARQFAAGDFKNPAFVHAGSVPGTAIMRAKRSAIRYQFHLLPGGGEVRITSHDSQAIAAIHQFLAYQRREHHAAGSVNQRQSDAAQHRHSME